MITNIEKSCTGFFVEFGKNIDLHEAIYLARELSKLTNKPTNFLFNKKEVAVFKDSAISEIIEKFFQGFKMGA